MESSNTINIHERLVFAFSGVGIALNVLDSDIMKDFFEDCFSFKIMTAQTYRYGLLPGLIESRNLALLILFFENDFCIYFDETTDSNGRYILNIMGKTLSNSATKCFLLNTVELERTNTLNVLREVDTIVLGLIKLDYKAHHFRFLVQMVLLIVSASVNI